MSEEEYVVEYIISARVVRKHGRKSWYYHVKWKGYDREEDNTWEPSDNFAGGSEHFITAFWSKVNIDRDHEELSLFQVNEEIFPTGPPARKKLKNTKGTQEVHIGAESSAGPSRQRGDSEDEVTSILDNPQTGQSIASSRKRRLSTVAESSSTTLAKRHHPNTKEISSKSTPSQLPLSGKRRRGRPPGIPQDAIVPSSEPELVPTPASSSKSGDGKTKRKSSPPLRTPSKRARKKKAISNTSTEEVPDSDEPVELPLRSSKKPASPTGVDDASVSLTAPPDGPLFGDETEVNMGSEIMAIGPPRGRPSVLSAMRPNPSKSTPALPAHRARAANPKVKMIGGPIAGPSISSPITPGSKEKEDAKKSAVTSVKRARAKPGPGRSSTGLFGTLPTTQPKPSVLSRPGPGRSSSGIKHGVANGSHVTKPKSISQTSVEADTRVDHRTSSSSNHANGKIDAVGGDSTLLESTEPDEQGKQLPDHDHAEDVVMTTDDVNEDGDISGQTQLEESPIVDTPLFPFTFDGNVPTSVSFGGGSSKRSTIFGPLGIGLTSNVSPKEMAESNFLHTFDVSLDAGISVPVTLKDIYPSDDPSMKPLSELTTSGIGPSGKFYKGEFALELMKTLRTGGSCARIVASDKATEAQKNNFQRFQQRLHEGDLFVAMIGSNTLAFCSSANQALGNKLKISSALIGQEENVLVSEVAVEDDNAYFEAIMHADESRWI
ncbi:hypothetical protein ABKN59_004145 [Abortiporus biennis]